MPIIHCKEGRFNTGSTQINTKQCLHLLLLCNYSPLRSFALRHTIMTLLVSENTRRWVIVYIPYPELYAKKVTLGRSERQKMEHKQLCSKFPSKEKKGNTSSGSS